MATSNNSKDKKTTMTEAEIKELFFGGPTTQNSLFNYVTPKETDFSRGLSGNAREAFGYPRYVTPKETDFSRGLSGNAREAFGYPRYVPTKNFLEEAVEKSKKTQNSKDTKKTTTEEEIKESNKTQNSKGGKKTKKLKIPKRKSYRKRTKKMRGGALDEQALLNLGFTEEQIAALQGYGIENMDLITMSLQQNNPQTGANFTPQELMDSLNDVQNEINNMEDDVELLDGVNPPLNEEPNSPVQMQMPNNVDQMPALAIEDLGPYSPRSVTEEPTGGNRRRNKRSVKKRNKRTMKRRNKQNKKTIKRGGGGCFGNGVGANAYDPNYSIFNTRELQLFPYRPN
jgi:hypothetical protein